MTTEEPFDPLKPKQAIDTIWEWAGRLFYVVALESRRTFRWRLVMLGPTQLDAGIAHVTDRWFGEAKFVRHAYVQDRTDALRLAAESAIR